MTATETIKQFVEKQTAYNSRIDAAVDGIAADIKGLDDLITQLQNSTGEVTPEDAALIDQLEAKSGALAQKIEALDAQRPPAPPTV